MDGCGLRGSAWVLRCGDLMPVSLDRKGEKGGCLLVCLPRRLWICLPAYMSVDLPGCLSISAFLLWRGAGELAPGLLEFLLGVLMGKGRVSGGWIGKNGWDNVQRGGIVKRLHRHCIPFV